LFEYFADMVISSCCSYCQLQLCIGPFGMVLGEVKQSAIYAKFGESSCKKVFKKQKIIPWLTEHDGVIHITPLPQPGAAFSARARGGRLCSYATASGDGHKQKSI